MASTTKLEQKTWNKETRKLKKTNLHFVVLTSNISDVL